MTIYLSLLRRIRFAPLNVPFKRRLQMLVVLWHSVSIPIFVTTFFALCAIPLFWPLILPYLLVLLFSSAGHDGTLSRRSEFVRGLRIWSLFASYFPARLHRSEVLPPTRKYVFGYHPHGECLPISSPSSFMHTTPPARLSILNPIPFPLPSFPRKSI